MKKLLKIVGWIAAVVAALLILLVVGLWLFFPIEKAKQMAVEKGSAQLGRAISVGDAQVSFWGGLGVTLNDVVVGNPEEFGEGDFLKADNVDVKLRILPLISGDYKIDRLIINRPEIVLRKRADGSNNYTFKAAEKKIPTEIAEQVSPEAKAAAAAVTFDRLEINNGLLSYTDDSSQISFDLKGLNLSTSLTSPRRNFYESTGEIEVDTVLVATDKPLPQLSVKLAYRADFDVDEQLLEFDETRLEVNGLPFDLEGQVAQMFGDMKAKAGIKSPKIAVSDLLSLVPKEKLAATEDYQLDGDLSLDIGLEYDRNLPDTLVYFGSVQVTSANVAHKDVPGELKFKKALIDFKNDNLRFYIEEGYFDNQPIKGHLVVDNFEDPVVNGELAGSMNLTYLQPFLPTEHGHQIGGKSDFNVKLSGSTKDFTKMSFSGDLKVAGGNYNSDLLPEPMKSFDLDVYFDNRLTNVKKLSAQFPSGGVEFAGRLNDLVPYFMADSNARGDIAPTVDGTLDGKLNLAVLNSLMPQDGKPELAGDFELKLSLTGPLMQYEKLRPRGTASIRKGSYTDSLLPEPIKHFEAELDITPDTISVKNLTAKFVSSDASFSGNLIDPFPYLLPLKTLDRTEVKKPLFLFKLTSHRFDADKLFPEAVPGSAENRATVAVDSVSPIILPDIDGQGTFAVDTMIYSKVEFSNLVGKVKIYDRKIECYDVTGKVYAGDVAGKTTIDLGDFENPKYVGEFQASNVEANEFVSRFSKFGGHIFGKANLSGTYDAVGWEPEQFLNSLNMNSVSSLNDGKLVTSGVMFSNLSELASKVGASFDKEQTVRNLTSNIIVADGKVSLDKFKTQLGAVGEVEIDGSYAFAGGLDYSGTILLSEGYSRKLLSELGGLGGFLTDRSVDRVKLPLLIGGTVDKPVFKLDYAALTKNIGENLKQDATNLLEGLIKKKK